MQASFWVQQWTRRITVSDQTAVGVMIEVTERDEADPLRTVNEPPPLGRQWPIIHPPRTVNDPPPLGRQWPIICLGKGEARALASAIMGAAAEL